MMTCAPGQFSLQLRAYYEFECCCSETQHCTGDWAIVTLCQCAALEPGECKYMRIATINMTGDIVWNVGPGATETTGRAKYSMFVLRCFDVAATPPLQPSPAQPSHSPFSLSSVRWNIFFINSQYFWVWVLGVWLLWVNLLVLCHPHLLYLWDLVALLRQPTLSQQRWSELPASHHRHHSWMLLTAAARI